MGTAALFEGERPRFDCRNREGMDWISLKNIENCGLRGTIEDPMNENTPRPEAAFMDMAAGIVAAYVANNSLPLAELPALITGVHGALRSLANGASEAAAEVVEKPTPAQVRKSITPDALISFIDGKPYKTLKRHLTKHGLDFSAYRERYGLPSDYPSTAASYSAQRSELAKSLGLGQQRRRQEKPSASAPKATKRRGKAKEAAAAE